MTGTRLVPRLLAGAAGLVCFAWTLHAGPPPVPAGGPENAASGRPAGASADEQRVPVAVARDRAKLMHDIYSATLDSMHHHFFRRERAVLPARAMEDVFAEVDRRSKIKTRWIAVNTPAMSINHEPETVFEKKAAAALAAGKEEFESVEKGYYLRAGAIPLGTGCVGCHTRFSATTDKTPRLAGLVIAMPVKGE